MTIRYPASEKLLRHVGHHIECVISPAENVAVECVDCNEVLTDEDVHAAATVPEHATDQWLNAPEPINCPGLPDDEDCRDDATNPCKACIAKGWESEGVDIEAEAARMAAPRSYTIIVSPADDGLGPVWTAVEEGANRIASVFEHLGVARWDVDVVEGTFAEPLSGDNVLGLGRR